MKKNVSSAKNIPTSLPNNIFATYLIDKNAKAISLNRFKKAIMRLYIFLTTPGIVKKIEGPKKLLNKGFDGPESFLRSTLDGFIKSMGSVDSTSNPRIIR